MAEIEDHDEIEVHEKVDQEKVDETVDEHSDLTEPKNHLLPHLQKEKKPNVDA
jgi:hypothetical protein